MKDFLKTFAPDISRVGSGQQLRNWAREVYLELGFDLVAPGPDDGPTALAAPAEDDAAEPEPQYIRVSDVQHGPDYDL